MIKYDILCIGTPNIIGDAVGPLVGTMLQQHEFLNDVNIVGTLEKPVVANNYSERIKELREDTFVIAVDAAFGKPGEWEIYSGPLEPGSALERIVAPIGDMSIKARTGQSLTELILCESTLVYAMATEITTRLIDLLKVTKKVYI